MKSKLIFVISIFSIILFNAIHPVFATGDFMQPPTLHPELGDVKPLVDGNCQVESTYTKQLQSPSKITINFTATPIDLTYKVLGDIKPTVSMADKYVILVADNPGKLDVLIKWGYPLLKRDQSGAYSIPLVISNWYTKNSLGDYVFKFTDQESMADDTNYNNCIEIKVDIISSPTQYSPTSSYQDKMENMTDYNTYEQVDFKLDKNPVICAFDPDPKNLQYSRNNLIDEVRYALLDWQDKLGQGYGKNNPWSMKFKEIPESEQYDFKSYHDCNVIIYFKPFFSNDNYITDWSAGGYTMFDEIRHRATIAIFYNNFQKSTSIGMVTRHELGHAFGLGHYIVSTQEYQKVVSGAEDYPSIMFPAYNGGNHFSIEPTDVNAIKKLYGNQGFNSSSLIHDSQFAFIPDYIRETGLYAMGGEYLTESGSVSALVPDVHMSRTLLNYLAFDGIIKIPNNYKVDDREYVFPENLTKSFLYPWVNHEISDYTFQQYLQYLIDNHKLSLY